MNQPESKGDNRVEAWEYPVNLIIAIAGLTIMANNNWEFLMGLAIFYEARRWAQDMRRRNQHNPTTGKVEWE